jgi:hypothetical protein
MPPFFFRLLHSHLGDRVSEDRPHLHCRRHLLWRPPRPIHCTHLPRILHGLSPSYLQHSITPTARPWMGNHCNLVGRSDSRFPPRYSVSRRLSPQTLSLRAANPHRETSYDNGRLRRTPWVRRIYLGATGNNRTSRMGCFRPPTGRLRRLYGGLVRAQRLVCRRFYRRTHSLHHAIPPARPHAKGLISLAPRVSICFTSQNRLCLAPRSAVYPDEGRPARCPHPDATRGAGSSSLL